MGLAACECGWDSAGEARGALLSGGLLSARPHRQLWKTAGSMCLSSAPGQGECTVHPQRALAAAGSRAPRVPTDRGSL